MSSVYNTYDRKIMEAVRILTMEEALCIVHDVAVAINDDRLRDLGASRTAGLGDSSPIRPGWISLRALDHAMRSAGYDMPGTQTHKDIVDVFGEEGAALMAEAQEKIEAYMVRLNSIMEQHECSFEAAMIIDMDNKAKEQLEQDPEDDLMGFGWD